MPASQLLKALDPSNLPPAALDVNSEVFVQTRQVPGFDLNLLNVVVRGYDRCAVCGAEPEVVRTAYPPVSEVRAGARSPIEAHGLCSSCNQAVVDRDVDALGERFKRGGGTIQLPNGNAAQQFATYFVDYIARRAIEPITWRKNDIRFARTAGMTPGTLGVSGTQHGLPCDAHEWLLNSAPCPAPQFHDFKNEYRHRYGCSIPSAEALDAIAAHSPGGLIDFGAGHGYWSYLLQARGLDCIAIDNTPVERGNNAYFPKENGFTPFSWTPIRNESDTKTVRKDGRNRSLLLGWPPPANSMALHALQVYAGARVFFLGMFDPEICATAAFFDTLERDWKKIDAIELPSLFGFDDALHIYERK